MTGILVVGVGILYLYIFITLGVTKPTLNNVAAAYYNKITPPESELIEKYGGVKR